MLPSGRSGSAGLGTCGTAESSRGQVKGASAARGAADAPRRRVCAGRNLDQSVDPEAR
jgi:hypothetical protein